MGFNGLDFALQIRLVLLPIAFIIILFGWLWQAKNYKVSSMMDGMKNIVGTFMVVALILGYPTLLLKGTDAVLMLQKKQLYRLIKQWTHGARLQLKEKIPPSILLQKLLNFSIIWALHYPEF